MNRPPRICLVGRAWLHPCIENENRRDATQDHRYRQRPAARPFIALEGQALALLTPQLAGILIQELGALIADWTIYRDWIIAALDFLLTGI